MTSVHFISPAPFMQVNGRVTSDLATGRYRVLIPAGYLTAKGHTVRAQTLPWESTAVPELGGITARHVVISKGIAPLHLALARELRKLKKRVIIDVTDDYFDHPTHGAAYRESLVALCQLAYAVVASSPLLADAILQYTGVTATVISDPVEGPRKPPRFAPQADCLRVLWFGSATNWGSVPPFLASLAALAERHPLHVELITKPLANFLDDIAGYREGPLRATLTPWTVDALWPALERADLVAIPSTDARYFASKSPNRVTESLWAGRMVVAHPVPSYAPFAEGAIITDDIPAAIERALANPGDILQRIARGQELVAQRHSPAVIGAQWEKVFGD